MTIAAVLAFACRDVPGRSASRDQLAQARSADEPVSGESSVAHRELAYAGCREMWLELQPRCVFEPTEPLRVWITKPAGTKVTVRVDGKARSAESYSVDGMDGFGLKVMLPPGASELVVELPDPQPAWSLPLRNWSDGLEPPPGTPTSGELDVVLGQAFEASRVGKHVQALKMLAEVEDLATRYPKGRADLATYRGIVFWQQGRYHDAATSLTEGVTFALRLHDAELINDSIHIYAGVLAELGYWDAAVAWSDQVLKLAGAEPDLISCVPLANVMSTVGYAHLLLARHRGESFARARSLLEQALARVGSTGECPEPTSVPPVVLSLADEAVDRGDPQAALDALAIVDFDDTTADERLRLRDVELRALDAAGRPLEELEQALARLEQEVTDAGLPEGRWRLALRRGDLLARQDRFEDAIEAYRQAEQEALAIAELAAVGVGRESAVALHGQSTERLVGLLVKVDRPDEALCAAREAQARRIQGVGGGSATAAQRETIDPAIEQYQSAKRALDEALAEERVLSRKDREALRFEVARNERQLATLANDILRDRSTWRPSCEDLVPRGTGELLLGIYPGSRGWFVFVQDDAGTHVRSIEGGPTVALDDPSLGAELLDPLTDHLVAATRIRVLASGRAQDIDVHLLSWNGAPLIEHVPVAYGAELPQPATPAFPSAGTTALLLADPTETLQMAPKEVQAAADWAKARGWTPDVPTPDEADRAHILQALADAPFFYFAGHGDHDERATRARALPPYAGGTRDWPAHLLLKPPSKLEIQDILMLPSAPRHVALLGCETGVPGDSGGGMSLALAFLVAGAEQVAATPVQTTEDTAATTGLGLLSGLHGRTLDLAAGLRSAQVAMLRRGDPVGRYRVWVR